MNHSHSMRAGAALMCALVVLGSNGTGAAAGIPGQVAWQWATLTEGSDVSGIVVTDWDGDGTPDILVGTSSAVVAIRHRGAHELEQHWAISRLDGGRVGEEPGSWGLVDLDGDGGRELWLVHASGRVVAYRPFEYQARELGWLALVEGESVHCAVVGASAAPGRIEVLAGVGPDLRAYHLPDLAESWRYDTRHATASRFVVAQVDADPGLEIVTEGGSVIDRAQSTEQWSYNDGFGTHMIVGDIDGDGVDEVLGSANWRVTAFDPEQRTPVWDLAVKASSAAFALADLDDVPGPELLVADMPEVGQIAVHDLASRAFLRSIRGPAASITSLAVGDADADARTDVVWAAAGIHLAAADAPVYDTSIRTRDGPLAVAAMQLDADTAFELVAFGQPNEDGFALPPHYSVMDSGTGTVEPGLELGVTVPAGWSPALAPLAANIDSDPYPELVVGIGQELQVLDHDGQLILRRDVGAQRRPTWVGDLDGDRRLDLVAVGPDAVHVHDLATLAETWRTDVTDQGVDEVAVGDVDGDGGREILFHGLGHNVHAYGGQSRREKWQLPADQQAYAIAVGNADGLRPDEIAVFEGRDTVAFYNGGTRGLIRRTTVPSRWCSESECADWSLQFAFLGPSGTPQLVATTSSHVYLFEHPYDDQPSQALALARPQVALADVDGDQHVDLLVGHRDGLVRYRMHEVLADRVPPQAWALRPRPGSSGIGRNVGVEVIVSEALRESTVTASNARMLIGGSPIPLQRRYDPATRVLQLVPNGALAPGVAVTVWLGPGLRDDAGNGLDGNANGVGGEATDAFTFSFVTGTRIDDAGPTVTALSLTPNPAWLNMPVALAATVDDTDPAVTTFVRRAEYFLDAPGLPGQGTPLSSADREFDSPREDVALILATTGWPEQRTVFVHAEDGAGNWGAFGAVTLAGVPEASGNWPTFGYDAAHSGHNPAEPAVPGYALAWEKDVAALFGGQNIQLGPATVYNGVVVTNADSYHDRAGIVGLDATDGGVRWQRPFEDKYSVNPTTIADGTVYFQECNHSDDSYLFALNALTGTERWRAPYRVQWEDYQAPVVAAGQVFVHGGSYGGLYAFDASKGYPLWFAAAPQNSFTSPAYLDHVTYTWGRTFFAAWRARDGALLWFLRLPWSHGGEIGHGFALDGSSAYLTGMTSSNRGVLSAVDLSARRERWQRVGDYLGTPAVADGVVYALDGTALQAVDAMTGDLMWSFEAGEPLLGAPAVTAGNVLCASAGHAWVVDPATHLALSRVPRGGWLTPANGQLFVAQANGRLAAFRPGAAPTVEPTATLAATPTLVPTGTTMPTGTPTPSARPGLYLPVCASGWGRGNE